MCLEIRGWSHRSSQPLSPERDECPYSTYLYMTADCCCTSTINMSSAPLSKYMILSLLLTHRDFCWVQTASRPYRAMKTSASVPAPNTSLVKVLIS